MDEKIKIAIDLMKNDSLEEALNILNEILREDKKNFEALKYKGNVLRLMGRFDEALEVFEEALAIKEDEELNTFRMLAKLKIK